MEFNLDDIKQVKRITALELEGSLDAEGVKAFVEDPCFEIRLVFTRPQWIKDRPESCK